MGRFERFMESWGLLTMDLMNSPSRWRRWAGIAIGALACWLMVALIGISWVQEWFRRKRQ